MQQIRTPKSPALSTASLKLRNQSIQKSHREDISRTFDTDIKITIRKKHSNPSRLTELRKNLPRHTAHSHIKRKLEQHKVLWKHKQEIPTHRQRTGLSRKITHSLIILTLNCLPSQHWTHSKYYVTQLSIYLLLLCV